VTKAQNLVASGSLGSQGAVLGLRIVRVKLERAKSLLSGPDAGRSRLKVKNQSGVKEEEHCLMWGPWFPRQVLEETTPPPPHKKLPTNSQRFVNGGAVVYDVACRKYGLYGHSQRLNPSKVGGIWCYCVPVYGQWLSL